MPRMRHDGCVWSFGWDGHGVWCRVLHGEIGDFDRLAPYGVCRVHDDREGMMHDAMAVWLALPLTPLCAWFGWSGFRMTLRAKVTIDQD